MAKKGHGHHGGAWKVAYADFVTAMMALFLVLWLTAQDEKIKEAVERAFKQPYAIGKEGPTSMVPKEGKDVGTAKNGDGTFDNASSIELSFLRKIAESLTKDLQKDNEDPTQSAVELKLSPEGLRISIFDRAKRPIFNAGEVQLTPYGKWVFETLAWELSRYNNNFNLELEGHTEKNYVPPTPELDKWELSTRRANVACRKLVDHGVQDAQILKVTGMADKAPMADRTPDDESNRRVNVLLKVRNTHQKG